MAVIRPNFTKAWMYFSEINTPVKEVGKIIGGNVKTNIDSGIFLNACPIRMSYVLFSIVLTSCANTPANASQMNTQKQNFKNWTISRCLAEISSDRQDALNTASGYLENSNLSIEAFENADKLVKKFIARDYSGSIPGTFNTKKCIELFYSGELEKLYQSAIK